MSDPFLPLAMWESGTTDNSIPSNDNALKLMITQSDVDDTTTAQPVSPADFQCHIIQSTHTGAQWSTFTPGDVAIYDGATWHAYAPTEGMRVSIGAEVWIYTGGAWTLSSGGGGGSTQGKQSIPIMAAGMRPSVSGGCQALAAIASAANQPDIVTLDFDPSTAEYAQFAIPMPKKWNAGTITARFRWSHASTVTNFGVVWGIQALAISDDDAIAQNYGTAQTVTDTGGTTNDLYVTAETSAITIAGTPAKQDTIFLRVYRDATNGSDTLAVDARLHSVEIFITTDADTDA